MSSLRERFEEAEGYIKTYYFTDAVNALKDIAYEYGQEETVDEFIDTDTVDDFVRSRLESSGWQGVACCLAKVDSINEDYYEIDGYGNLKEITQGSLQCTLSDLKRNLADEFEEEDEDEEE